MKRSILIWFLITSVLSHAQSPKEVFKKLAKAGVLKNNQRSEFIDYMSNTGNSKGEILASLYGVKFDEYSGGSKGYYMSISFDTTGITNQVKADTKKDLTGLMVKLRSCGLVNDQTFLEFNELIKKFQYSHELQLLDDLTKHTAYAEWIAPNSLHAFADSLLTKEIMSEEAHANLRSQIDAGKIKTHFQLLDFCNHAVFFDLAQYPDDPQQYVPQIHKQVSKLFPELQFTDFTFRIVVDSINSDSTYTSHDLVVSLRCNGKQYQQKSFIALEHIKEHQYLGKIDQQQFYQIFNKVLADTRSSYRLYQVKPDLRFGANYQYFGIIGLKESQTETFRQPTSRLEISYENHDNVLTSTLVDDAITEYQNLGLFNHLTNEQILSAKENIAQANIFDLNHVLSHFPNVVHHFDTELANLEDPYRELLQAYKDISHGAFNPADIVDGFDLDKEEFQLQFTLNGKSFSTALRTDGDWVDLNFFTFIDTVIKENNIPGRFYSLIGNGQYAAFIFLNDQQYSTLREKKLLIFGDEG